VELRKELIWSKGAELHDCWERTAHQLADAGLLAYASRDHLVICCCAWSDWIRSKREKAMVKITKAQPQKN